MRANHLITIAGIGVLGIAFARYTLGSDFLYSRDVDGRVVAHDKRLDSMNKNVYEKVSLRLNPFNADAQVRADAEGSEGLDVECISTKCTLFKEGDCVMLTCKRDVRFFEPNVIVCKAVKTVVCKE